MTTPFANYRIAHVHPAFEARGFRVVALEQGADVRAEFTPRAESLLTTYIGGVGHGAYGLYTGHSGRPHPRGRDDDAEQDQAGPHMPSCQIGRDSGRPWRCGGAGYAGYTEKLNPGVGRRQHASRGRVRALCPQRQHLSTP